MCSQRSVKLRSGCVHLSKLLSEILIPFVLVGILLVHLYARKKRREADSVWKIDPKEVIFHEPPETLGRGSFGLVLLADYRGTKVAVKRTNPQSSPRKGKNNNNEPNTPKLDEEGEGEEDASYCLGGSSKKEEAFSGRFDGFDAISADSSSPSRSSDIRMSPLGSSSDIVDALYWGFRKRRAEANMIEEIRKISKLRYECIMSAWFCRKN